MTTLDTEAPIFSGGGLTGFEVTDQEVPSYEGGALVSPFAAGLTSEDESVQSADSLEALVAELEDEEFDETVEGLVDEVAGHHLRALTRYGDQEQVADQEAEQWLEQLGESVDRGLAELEQRFADRRLDSFGEGEVAGVLGEYARDPESSSEQFLGGLVKKAFSAAKAVAAGAVKGLSRLVPLGPVFAALRKLVRPLLRRVLSKAINRLPAPLRGPATQLAHRLGLSEAEAEPSLTEAFDAQLAEALLAPSDAAQEQVLSEAAYDDGAMQSEDPLSDLDRARATLARQLSEAEPGRPPTEQLEQFIPVVMAAMPLIRTGVRIIGRDRIKNFVAGQLATLIQGYVGPQAARALAPHVADAGLRLLSLESAAPEQLGAEALVDTLQEAVVDVMSLPAEALDDPLRLEAEVGDALGAAAVRNLPPAVLRDDLPDHDPDRPGWVAMPRAGRARRYRRSARRFDVTLTRARAGEVELPGAETLEERLLDAGVATWPVNAEVQVFETMTGGHLGHLAAGEGEGVLPAEFEELSPATAGLLLGRAALGTRPGVLGPAGRRYFRVVVPGRRVVRHRSRIAFRLRPQLARPELRVHLRVGERTAHRLAGLLERQEQTEVVATVGRLLGRQVQEAAALRLPRMLGRATRSTVAPARGQALAAHVVEAMKSTLARELPAQAAAMATAAKDPAPGLTLTFAFAFADATALASGMPGAPTLTIRAGRHSD
ncbi:hypothetical protein ASC64_00555 [Nocardioides sp. Root122]|uniref:hypothetical protein n=1 Tax=Nocardioides TaxID=1839 RepID=UPI000703B4C7|nr:MULTISPECIES: hypothetical protein [Nocardioides]KQV77379.1 hypothetical protein ASC64_00555 [Nocardioides sp. Root122]MCK9824555.1 hypothetical protein [Nocardioides cavernae]